VRKCTKQHLSKVCVTCEVYQLWCVRDLLTFLNVIIQTDLFIGTVFIWTDQIVFSSLSSRVCVSDYFHDCKSLNCIANNCSYLKIIILMMLGVEDALVIWLVLHLYSLSSYVDLLSCYFLMLVSLDTRLVTSSYLTVRSVDRLSDLMRHVGNSSQVTSSLVGLTLSSLSPLNVHHLIVIIYYVPLPSFWWCNTSFFVSFYVELVCFFKSLAGVMDALHNSRSQVKEVSQYVRDEDTSQVRQNEVTYVGCTYTYTIFTNYYDVIP